MGILTVSVTDFGAVPYIEQQQTDAFQKAIDYCFEKGGGEVQVPEGSFVVGDIRLRSNITLHLMENAVILGSLNPKAYQHINEDKVQPLPPLENTRLRWLSPWQWAILKGQYKAHLYSVGSYWNYGIIRAAYAENIAIIGEKGSKIDGRNIYDPEGEEFYRGPHAVNMHHCKNVRFEGYAVENSSNWAHAIFQSENVEFKNLTVEGGHDALHVRCCKNVEIDNCRLITGDDCVAGFGNLNVHINNCYISSACSAFRFGGANILIENCEVYAPCKYPMRGTLPMADRMSHTLDCTEKGRHNMLCFFTYFVSDDLPALSEQGKITVKNCTVIGADKFFHLNLSGNEAWQRGNPPTDICFENIKAENISGGICAYGNGKVPFEMTFKNVEYSVREGYEKEPFMLTANFGKLELDNVKVTGYNGNAFIKGWSEKGDIVLNDFECENIKDGEFYVLANEEFKCRPI